MFDYLNYKNKIPLDKCVINIPKKLNPAEAEYKRFWIHNMFRKVIEGMWVSHNGEYKWIPGPLVLYTSLWSIKMKVKGVKSAGKSLGRPRLRDLEWIKGYIHATARGFSGFEKDDEYSCHRWLIDKDEDEIGLLEDYKINSIKKKDGSYKTYKPALEYLYEYQSSNLGKPLYYNEAKNVVDIEARDMGKDLWEFTKVFTENGEKFIKDVIIGEKIYDNEGLLTTVTNKINFNNQLQYMITLQDGRIIKAGAGHNWGVFDRGVYRIVNTNTLLNCQYKVDRGKNGMEYRWRIPLTKPIQFPEKELLLDPYLLGTWLGDGTNKQPQITTIDEETVIYLNQYCLENNLSLSKCGITYTITKGNNRINLFTKALRELNLVGNKHIPNDYFSASYKQRLALLQGLMDTDGSIDKNGYSEFIGVNKRLVEDVQRLCWTLGIRVSISEKETSWTHKLIKKYSKAWRLSINTNERIFRLSRKLSRLRTIVNKKVETSQNSIAIVDIQPLDVKPSVCLEVSNKSKLFLAADYIVTHNSMISGCFCGHNFLTDGVMDFDEWLEEYYNKPEGERRQFNSNTLVSAINSFYSSQVIEKIKDGLNNIPGGQTISGDYIPAPLSKMTTGSWEPAKNRTAQYEIKEGGKMKTKGSGSTIMHRSFGQDEFAANGSRYSFGLVDEVGLMGNLLLALAQLHDCTTVDRQKYGTIWMTGTGGDMDGGATEQVKKVFYSPAAYDCLEFDDIFENTGKKIGLFIPSAMAYEFRDEFGNVDRAKGQAAVDKKRKEKERAKEKEALNGFLQMHPSKPSEAFLSTSGNIFPVLDLSIQLALVQSSEDDAILGEVGDMIIDSNGSVDFMPDISDKRNSRVLDYPIKKGQNNGGCVVVWQRPDKNSSYGYYIAGCDPYAKDQAENTQSVGSFFILKRKSAISSAADIIVAEYTARPSRMDDFFEQARRLLIWYNGLCLFENNFQNMKSYFQNKTSLQYLAMSPGVIKASKESLSNSVYGLRMTEQTKEELELYLCDWLTTPVDSEKMNLHYIYSPGLLKELIAYDGKDVNTDRVISLMLAVAQIIQMRKIVSEKKKEIIRDPFFSRALFINRR